MKKILSVSLLALPLAFTFASCSAPKGKTYAAMNRQPPIAAGPSELDVERFESQRDTAAFLKSNGTLTVWLSSKPETGYSWRLAEIPDPSVLKLISKEYVAPSKSNMGQEKWVFQATGDGTVEVRLWYTSMRREQFGSAPVFKCVVTVGDDLPPVALGSEYKGLAPVESKPAKPRKSKAAKPKVHRTTPDPETRPFLEPVFRSSRVLLRNESDSGKHKG